MTELLVEIYSEEIPSRMQKDAISCFKDLFLEFFKKENIQFSQDNIFVFITPRRLVFLAKDIAVKQIIPTSIKIGPRVGSNSRSIQGFLRSVGLQRVDELSEIKRENGQYYSYTKQEEKIDTALILKKGLPLILQKMSGKWSKSMDLIDLSKKSNWVRPIRNILTIFNGQVLDFKFANLFSNNKSYGHFLRGKNSFEVNNFRSYKQSLKDNFVILDQIERKEVIVAQIKEVIQDNKMGCCDDIILKNIKLIDEIVGLVEYPKVLAGKIDQEFNFLPKEVLELTIKIHQKAIFIKKESNGQLYFIFVSNIEASKDANKKIIADNEKVARARLSDAKFFWAEDLSLEFSTRQEMLRNVILHKKVGSVYAKTKRLEILSKFITIWVPRADLALAEKIAQLSKNDLTTKMVAELPELQGVIGGHYASSQGEDSEVSLAVSQQYLPIGQNSELPNTPMAVVLSIADKIDTIVSMFLVGEVPTASKDPFAIRRAALGVIKILLDQKISLPLRIVIEKSINSFSTKRIKEFFPDKSGKEIKILKQKLSFEILNFFVDRNKFYLKDSLGLKADIINEVFNQYLQEKDSRKCDLFILSKKAVFINNFVVDKSNIRLIELYKRVVNIINIEEKQSGKAYTGKVPIISLKNKYEKLLYKRALTSAPSIKKASKDNDYQKTFDILLDLELSIKCFFDNVEINCEDKHLKEKRLLILSKVRNLFKEVFDFSKIDVISR